MPIWYRGADPVCGFCRGIGHKSGACADLKKQICFKCNNRGHTRRFCSKVEDDAIVINDKPVVSEADLLDKYINDTEVLKEPSKQQDKDQELIVVDNEELPTAEKDFDNLLGGTNASKHATFEVGRTMP